MGQGQRFADKSEAEVMRELVGFPPAVVEAVVGFHRTPTPAALDEMVVRVLEFYAPPSAPKPFDVNRLAARLNQDLSIDSLALAEAAFKLDDVLGVPIELHEAGKLDTLGAVLALVREKCGLTAVTA